MEGWAFWVKIILVMKDKGEIHDAMNDKGNVGVAMTNKGKVIGGVLLLLLGVGLLLEVIGVVDFNFSGWWTMFIIVPCLVSFFGGKNRTMSLIGVGVGVLLLLAAQGVVPWDDLWKYIVCVVFILWGIMLIFDRGCHMGCAAPDQRCVDELKRIDQDGRSIRQINVAFGKHGYVFAGQRFEGAKVQASFGFVGIDLRGADVLDGAVVEIDCSFGGLEIRVDNDVVVKQAVETSFAGVECKEHLQTSGAVMSLYLKGNCSFGGIEIK